MNSPVRHHFVPEVYQNGFLDGQGRLFVLRKPYETIKERYPSQVLYKENLHTLYDGDSRNVAIETFYSQIEGEFAKYRNLLRNVAQHPFTLKELESDSHFKRVAKIVVAMQFWRVPYQSEKLASFSGQLLSLYDAANDECKELLGKDRKFIKYLQRKASKANEKKIIQFLLLPLLSFDIWSDSTPVRLVSAGAGAEGGKSYLTSDQPVIYNDFESLFGFERFMFPLSKDVAMVSEGCVGMATADVINSRQFANAHKIVLSASRDLLEKCRLTNR